MTMLFERGLFFQMNRCRISISFSLAKHVLSFPLWFLILGKKEDLLVSWEGLKSSYRWEWFAKHDLNFLLLVGRFGRKEKERSICACCIHVDCSLCKQGQPDFNSAPKKCQVSRIWDIGWLPFAKEQGLLLLAGNILVTVPKYWKKGSTRS